MGDSKLFRAGQLVLAGSKEECETLKKHLINEGVDSRILNLRNEAEYQASCARCVKAMQDLGRAGIRREAVWNEHKGF